MPSIRKPEEVGTLTKTSSTTISLSASRLNIGGQQYAFSAPIQLYVGTTGFGGMDLGIEAWKIYRVYAVVEGAQVGLVASLQSETPVGFGAARFVGYMDTGATGEINGAGIAIEGKVGDIKSALLTESQFQSENGIGWILADGRDVGGSRFSEIFGASIIPDLRGVALRGKNNGRADGKQNPDGDIGLGAYQADQIISHRHNIGIRIKDLGGSNDGGTANREVTAWDSPGYSNYEGGNETRMKNVTVNFFVKVN